MADLMSGKYTFEGLAKKYKDFMVPAFKIKVRGKDIVSSLKLAVEDMTIALSMDAANSCSFNIVNAYDRQSSSFSGEIKSQLVLGTVFTVEIGYGSHTTIVFKGYVSELAYEFSDYPVISVSALDVRRLMMDGGNRMLLHSVQSYSAAFTEVMKRYQKICTSLVIDHTDKNLPHVAQTSTDFEFVSKELSVKGDREFFVLADKAYFRKPQDNPDSLMTLEWGNGLLSFSRNAMYHNEAIRVIGFNEMNKNVLVAEENVKSSDKQTNVIEEPQPTVFTQPDAQEIAQVNMLANSEGKKRKQKNQGGSGVCIGLPEIVPGRFIELKSLDKDLDNNYYIKTVNHTINSNGFTTKFSVGGWK